MAAGHNPEKITSLEETIEQPKNDQTPTNTSKEKPRSTPAFRAWPFLVVHALCSVALSLVLVLAIDGYNAIDTSTPHYLNSNLRLRVSDITTLVSAGLVIIKILVTSWSAVVIWKCAYILTHGTEVGLSSSQLSFMTKYKLPPWLRYPFQIPKGFRSWSIAAVLLSILPQSFIAPLLSGAVDWNPSSVHGFTTISVNSRVPNAAFNPEWYQYTLESYLPVRKSTFRVAAGLASLAWSDKSTVSETGISLTGNGCRHVVNDDGLLPNSTLANAIIPCIKIDSISWAKSDDDIPRTVSNLIKVPGTLIDDNPQQYRTPGQAVLFDPENPWNSSQYGFSEPTPIKFSSTMKLGLLIADEYAPNNSTPQCTKLSVNRFGDVSKIQHYIYPWAEGTCYLVGTVSLTAGVTTSAQSIYISSRVVEDQTPIDKVVFQANSWVQESLWLLPDLMTMVAVMNSTLLPTWNNLDLYAENLIRQSYLAAWDGLHATFDESNVVYEATRKESRIQASVSYERVFSWLGISLLMTIGGALLLLPSFGGNEPDMPGDEIVSGATEEGTSEAKAIINELISLNYF